MIRWVDKNSEKYAEVSAETLEDDVDGISPPKFFMWYHYA